MSVNPDDSGENAYPECILAMTDKRHPVKLTFAYPIVSARDHF
jgi:hypothetical protein